MPHDLRAASPMRLWCTFCQRRGTALAARSGSPHDRRRLERDLVDVDVRRVAAVYGFVAPGVRNSREAATCRSA
jgi:hypothetical protein